MEKSEKYETEPMSPPHTPKSIFTCMECPKFGCPDARLNECELIFSLVYFSFNRQRTDNHRIHFSYLFRTTSIAQHKSMRGPNEFTIYYCVFAPCVVPTFPLEGLPTVNLSYRLCFYCLGGRGATGPTLTVNMRCRAVSACS